MFLECAHVPFLTTWHIVVRVFVKSFVLNLLTKHNTFQNSTARFHKQFFTILRISSKFLCVPMPRDCRVELLRERMQNEKGGKIKKTFICLLETVTPSPDNLYSGCMMMDNFKRNLMY